MDTTKLRQWSWMLVILGDALSGCGADPTGQITDPQGLPAPINVRIWVDNDGDGKRTVAEPPLSGVAVQLVDPDDGKIVDEAVSNSNGEAEVVGLQDLIPGYQVRLVVPEGYTATTPDTVLMQGFDYRANRISFGIAPQEGG